MKKTLFFFVFLLFLALLGTYILIPATIKVSESVTIHAPKNALYRKLVNAGAWREWWPEKQDPADTGQAYILQETRFYPGEPKVISLPVVIKSANLSGQSELTFIPLGIDFTSLQFDVSIPTSNNPFKKIAVYFKSKKLGKQFSTLLASINNMYSSTRNLYTYDIQKKRVVDTTLIFTFTELNKAPDMNTIYSLVDKLKEYISRNKAKETGHPMLNIVTNDSSHFLVKVAIPVDRKLPSSGDISSRWMLGGGNILVTEVKGGQIEIDNAYQQILNFIADYKRVAPAIPFESLVTDRRKEKDSSQWVTRIYYPVM